MELRDFYVSGLQESGEGEILSGKTAHAVAEQYARIFGTCVLRCMVRWEQPVSARRLTSFAAMGGRRIWVREINYSV